MLLLPLQLTDTLTESFYAGRKWEEGEGEGREKGSGRGEGKDNRERGEGKGGKKREKEDGRLSSGYKLSHPPPEKVRES